MERIVITFNKDATFRGASVTDHDGLPKPLDPAALNAIFPDVDAAALARVAELEKQLESLPEKDQQIADLEARVAELTQPPAGASPLTQLNEAFETLIPAELQPAFRDLYLKVRVAIEADRLDWAAEMIAETPVPEELAEAKAQFLSLIQS